MLNKLCITSLLDIEHTIAKKLFSCEKAYPWETLESIGEFIKFAGPTLDPGEFENPYPNVWIAKDASVYPNAEIKGPCIIDHQAEIRHCAFIRGNAIIGKNAVVGNSTEIKNAVLFDCVQVPHFNYVGDSVLGYRSHLGAGAVTSNVKSDKSNVNIRYENVLIKTGLRKFGAILGDCTEVGCNSVLCPGTVTGRNVTIYPTSMVRGYVQQDSIFKNNGEIIQKKEKE